MQEDGYDVQYMIAPLAKFIDWSALQMAYAFVGLRHVPKPKWKLEESLEFLNGPDFIPAASDTAQIEFDGPGARGPFAPTTRDTQSICAERCFPTN
jgi:hypothetical protein